MVSVGSFSSLCCGVRLLLDGLDESDLLAIDVSFGVRIGC